VQGRIPEWEADEHSVRECLRSKAQMDKAQLDIAKTNFSERFGLYANSTRRFGRPDETLIPHQTKISRENPNRRTFWSK
jgi:hypothetical protein